MAFDWDSIGDTGRSAHFEFNSTSERDDVLRLVVTLWPQTAAASQTGPIAHTGGASQAAAQAASATAHSSQSSQSHPCSDKCHMSPSTPNFDATRQTGTRCSASHAPRDGAGIVFYPDSSRTGAVAAAGASFAMPSGAAFCY